MAVMPAYICLYLTRRGNFLIEMQKIDSAIKLYSPLPMALRSLANSENTGVFTEYLERTN